MTSLSCATNCPLACLGINFLDFKKTTAGLDDTYLFIDPITGPNCIQSICDSKQFHMPNQGSSKQLTKKTRSHPSQGTGPPTPPGVLPARGPWAPPGPAVPERISGNSGMRRARPQAT